MPPLKMQDLVAIASDRSRLECIARPQVALAIWWRTLSARFRRALDGVDLAAVPDLSIRIDAWATVRPVLRKAGYEAGILDCLSADMDLLLRRHAALTGADHLHMRLGAPANGDAQDLRAGKGSFSMVCTYLGPGTQWWCSDGEDAICEIPTGSVGVFKGRTLLDPPRIVHRSPPCSGSGARRLVLTIEPA